MFDTLPSERLVNNCSLFHDAIIGTFFIYFAVTSFIINKNHPFGNEKRSNCENFIKLLLKHTSILFFFDIYLKD